MDSVILLEKVNKSFKDNHVLKDVSAEFERGRIHGIIGRNGSGKTVLLKCICGFLHPDSGTISIDGKRVLKQIPDNLGVIIETPGFLKNYSAFSNLSFLARINNRIDKEEVMRAIALVGLGSVGRKHVGKFSLGMRQRLAIAQAVMEKQQVLILDEPMNALDKQGLADMRELFLKLRDEGRTILLASHSAEDIGILCNSVYEIDRGEMTKIR